MGGCFSLDSDHFWKDHPPYMSEQGFMNPGSTSTRSSPVERLEEGYPFFPDVYFSRGTLPTKKETVRKGTGGPRWAEQIMAETSLSVGVSRSRASKHVPNHPETQGSRKRGSTSKATVGCFAQRLTIGSKLGIRAQSPCRQPPSCLCESSRPA